MENKEIATMKENDREETVMASSMNVDDMILYQSFQPATIEDRMKIYNLTVSTTGSIKEMTNRPLMVKDVIVFFTEIVDQQTGELTQVPRTVLITEDDNSYSASSWGVYRCIQKMASIFGDLHFDPAIKITPMEVKTKKGFTINLIVG